jgi:hypothetical protein
MYGVSKFQKKKTSHYSDNIVNHNNSMKPQKSTEIELVPSNVH